MTKRRIDESYVRAIFKAYNSEADTFTIDVMVGNEVPFIQMTLTRAELNKLKQRDDDNVKCGPLEYVLFTLCFDYTDDGIEVEDPNQWVGRDFAVDGF